MANEKAIMLTVVNNEEMYNRLIADNPYIKNNSQLSLVKFKNYEENLPIPVRFNSFLDTYDFSQEAWFIFCHNDWELREDINLKLRLLDKNSIYGPIGTRNYVTRRFARYHYVEELGIAFRKPKRKRKHHTVWFGECHHKTKHGENELIMRCVLNDLGIVVDAVDAQCFIAHSSLFAKYSLRFDEKLIFDFYCEDLSFSCKTRYGVETRIVPLNCCHGCEKPEKQQRHDYKTLIDYMDQKYPDQAFSWVLGMLGGKKPLKHSVCWPTNIPMDLNEGKKI